MSPIRGKSKKFRARSAEERNLRLKQVAKLRFIQCWQEAEIAEALSVDKRTIERDVRILKQRMRKTAQKNLDFEIRDIVEQLKLAHEEKIKHLWNEFVRLEETVTKAQDDKQKLALQESTRPARIGILRQITITDDSFVEQLRKLGLVHGEMEVDDDGEGSFLLEIKARKAKIDSLRKNTGEVKKT
jgi:hypothetical protein